MSFESGSQFLKEKYDLHKQPEVDAAIKKKNTSPERDQLANPELDIQKISTDPNERIQTYLDRLENIFNPPALEGSENFDRGERNLSLIKNGLHRNFVIRPEEVPQSYWETQQRLARELGHGNIEITEDLKKQNTEVIIADQESSLDNWVDYLASEDAPYPLWLKYFAVRGILGMSTYDKEKHQFNKRDKGTTAPFPDLDREALAVVLDAVEKRQGPEYRELTEQIRQVKNELKRLKGEVRTIEKQNGDSSLLVLQLNEKEELISNLSKEQANLVTKSLSLPDESRTEFTQLLQTSDFSKLYAWALEKVTPAEENELLNTDGEWIKYDQGSNPKTLVESLQGHGTGWCTAGESVAQKQLEAGDFYVFYSQDKEGNPTVPRAAIRMQGNQIGEVRGIAHEQNLDAHIGKVVQDKMREFPDGASYEKKAFDMRLLTYIDRKVKTDTPLDRDDLKFLYEIDNKIKGFGYGTDPRIEELRDQRDPIADAAIVFECLPSQIAQNIDKISEDTKAYIGPLEPGIFDIIQKYNIEHIYRSFPEDKIERIKSTIGGKSKNERVDELKDKDINFLSSPESILNNPEFSVQEHSEEIDLIKLSVRDLGFPGAPTTFKIYARAKELGLELCPAETGLSLPLEYNIQARGDWYFVAIKPIMNRRGCPGVFGLHRSDDGLWLCERWAEPAGQWSPDHQFVFRLRKVPPES
jgi:hypothetical protein